MKDEKGDIWVCGLDAEQPWCDKTKCAHCGRICYYVAENYELVKKNAKKICPICALGKYSEDLPEDMKKILEMAIRDFG